MAFCRVVFALLVLSVINCYSSKVPVFLWGDNLKSSVKSNPLTTYSTEEFVAIVKQVLVEDPVVLVFIEENLSVEDFSLKNDDGESSYPYLHDNLQEAVYLPTVNNPLAALRRAAGPDARDVDSENFAPNGDKFVFISLNDAEEGESRAHLLSRHDAFMQDTISQIPEDTNVVAVYTANYPSWTIPVSKSRVRRATEETTTARASQVYTVDGLRLATSNVVLKAGNDTRTLETVTAQSSEVNDTFVNAVLTFDNTTLVLHFTSKAGYWFFNTVDLTVGDIHENLYPREEVYAVLGFSYRCAQYVSFSSRNETTTYTVTFNNSKIQPYFQTNTTQEFGDSFNCVGFFSAPIWAGLFVVFILLAITFYGIMMMLDIRTMDRFDDPKGKTITINAVDG